MDVSQDQEAAEPLKMAMPSADASAAMAEEEKKQVEQKTLSSQSSVISAGGGVALSGNNKLSLGFYNLN